MPDGLAVPRSRRRRAPLRLRGTPQERDRTIVAVLRLFAQAREAAGTARDELAGATVADVLAAARSRYGAAFAAVLATSKVWVNGEPASDADPVGAADEVAVLPPVSGG